MDKAKRLWPGRLHPQWLGVPVAMLPLVVDNDPSKIKWVLFVSSGGDHGPLIQYFVGDFDGVRL
jgi:hypothetical protein